MRLRKGSGKLLEVMVMSWEFICQSKFETSILGCIGCIGHSRLTSPGSIAEILLTEVSSLFFTVMPSWVNL